MLPATTFLSMARPCCYMLLADSTPSMIYLTLTSSSSYGILCCQFSVSMIPFFPFMKFYTLSLSLVLFARERGRMVDDPTIQRPTIQDLEIIISGILAQCRSMIKQHYCLFICLLEYKIRLLPGGAF